MEKATRLNGFKWMFDMFMTGVLGASPIQDINEDTAKELRLDPDFVPVEEYPSTVESVDGEIGYCDRTKKRYVVVKAE